MTFVVPVRRAFVGCVLTALSFAACAESSTSTRPPASEGGNDVSACDLLTTQEASAAMGRAMLAGTEKSTDGGTLCEWLSTDPPSEGLDEPINLTVALLPMRPAAQQKFELLASSPDDRVVPGLGDLAVADCTFGDTDYCGELYVVVGEQYLAVDMGNFTWPGDYATTELLGIVTGVANQAILRVRK